MNGWSLTKFTVVATMLAAPLSVNATTLLNVDLGTVNQITVSATSGASSATVSGSDITGIYLAGFFTSLTAGIDETLVSGNLTSAMNPSGAFPLIFTADTADTGLNLFSLSSDGTLDFVSGELAFEGSATWTVDAADYAALLASNLSGDLFFPADDIGDLPTATLIGEWARVDAVAAVPVPAAGLLLGGALFGFGVFGRRAQKA